MTVRESANKNGLAEVLLVIQAEGISLQKNAINPHFKNRYITLDELMEKVLPILNSKGVLLLQSPSNIMGVPALRTVMMHPASGEQIESTMPLVLGKDDPQGQGSAITYARRYSLMSILGLVADEDNDAHGTRVRATYKKNKPAQVVNTPSPSYDETGTL